ncbi:MAG TPA: NAD-glutamate dehydrogenase domain-containing protein, partial [Geminicoccaceae bacterium]|nr:NAD-glutamate dehydrogenase domain-containing protein [Geminicoccaceae bacterium]
MAIRLEERKAELLDRLTDRLRERLDDRSAGLADQFVRHYYRGVAPEDLLERDPLDLYGAALAHLRFGERRRPGEAKVRVYNPQVEQHGWQSTHTVVEVVNDDMPFLVDSVGMALNRRGLAVHLTIHPVIPLRRDAEGRIEQILCDGEEGGDGADRTIESFIHVEVDRHSDPAVLAAIEADLVNVLEEVRAAVEDWRPMLARVDGALTDLDVGAGALDPEELAEAKALLRWVADNHFTFLGYACYDLVEEDGLEQLRRRQETGLGILRKPPQQPMSRTFATLPPEVRRRARERKPLIITKANTRSPVHRPVHLDYLGVKRFDPGGDVIGEHRFLGLFTSAAYNRNPRDIPVLRRKVARIVAQAGLPPNSHDLKALLNILETYPRDELFQTPDEELFPIVMGILQLQERQRIRLFMRRDVYGRFVTCHVFVPRERYNTQLRTRMQRILQDALGGTEVEYQAQLSESVLARLLFTVRTPDGTFAEADAAELEARLVEAARTWGDVLRRELIDAAGEEEGVRLYRAYGEAFPVGYQAVVPAPAAVPDVLRIDRLARGLDDLAMSLYRPLEADPATLRFKLGRADHAIPLSDALPVLENMGLRVIDEHPYAVRAADGRTFWLHDFGMVPTDDDGPALDLDRVRGDFQELFGRVWRGETENDGFNRLALRAGLDWRQVTVLRAYCKYMLQIGTPFSQAYIEQTLASNPRSAARLALLFDARFDPEAAGDREARCAALEAEIREGLEAVVNLDEDRILRRYLHLLLATLRTNAFQHAGQRLEDGREPKPYLSLKFDPHAIRDMPLPRPQFEIFVYSPRTEAVHLRGGRVARGGLRWSDRREDFRTEVLGLMKAQ